MAIELATPTAVDLVDHLDLDPSLDDGWGGEKGGSFDPDTGILTLRFTRDNTIDDASAEKYGYTFASTEYRFQLIPAALETP